ncbi:6542_t:CDS:10 [Gigaspora margarita]|uniref:6542_t:CDS:1 n=1 Tax=Gigaspora margarita TaxID=4874 RepID=A0ABN7URL1_GIGMA|nr:6542_t:CDS:10 [Gigaspora margarita]
MVKWYKQIIAQLLEKKKINPELEILPLHNQLKAISLQESPSTNAGYYHYQLTNKKDEWFPLLPGYSIFFKTAEKIWKFSIISENSHLKFLWKTYDNANLQQPKTAAVLKHYPNIFLNQQKLINATKTEELLHANLKRKADQISNDFEYKESCLSIKYNILLEKEEQLEGELEKTNINEEDLLELNVKNAIKLAKLGSAILISTEQYLSLVLMQPCQNCNNKSFIDKVLNVISIGFQVKCIVKCKICNTIFEHINETKDIQFTKAVAASGLTAGISHNASHVQNANQDSGELIYQEILPDYSHKPIVAFHTVEKTRFAKDSKLGFTKIIHQGNSDKSSRQMEHAILIEVLNQISPLLEEASLHLEICIDGDLDSNKTLANVPIVSNIYADLKHLTKNIRNSLRNHIMRWCRGCIYSAALKIEGLISHLQNNHTSCWSDICWTKDDPKIILQEPTLCHSSNNQINEFQKLLEEIFAYLEIYSGKPFETEDLHNINAIEKERCIGCHTFPKYTKGLCALCYIYQVFGWKNRILNPEGIKDDIYESMNLIQQIEVITEKIFQYTNLRSGQLEAIESYIGDKKDTLVILKTGGEKSFCYTASAILFDGLIIVISPLKSLIQNQMNHFVQLGVLYSGLLISLKGTIEYESKLFDEIFGDYVIFCIILESYKWGKLGILKQYFSDAQIMALTATLFYADVKALQINLNFDPTCFATIRGSNLFRKELCFSVQSRIDTNLAWADEIVNLVKNIEKSGCTIIYCAWISDCLDVFNTLSTKLEELSLDIYNGQLTENMPDVRLVIHYNFLMNMTSLIQASGWAGQDQQKAKYVILYSQKDIHINYSIIAENRESADENDENDEKTINQECFLKESRHKLFEDKVKLKDVKTEILDLLKVVEVLCENNDKPIVPLDVIDIFCLLNNARLKNRRLKLMELTNHQKPKLLHTKALAKLALADLVRHGFVNQTIWLE